jgi:hypothetical protein
MYTQLNAPPNRSRILVLKRIPLDKIWCLGGKYFPQPLEGQKTLLHEVAYIAHQELADPVYLGIVPAGSVTVHT